MLATWFPLAARATTLAQALPVSSRPHPASAKAENIGISLKRNKYPWLLATGQKESQVNVGENIQHFPLYPTYPNANL